MGGGRWAMAMTDVMQKSHTSLDPIQVRQVARETALEAIQVQKSEMKQLGVLADWNDVYRTLGESVYRANI